MLSVLATAAKESDVDSLYKSIRVNPKILKEIEDTPFADTPLHVAASNGNTIFVAEMMNLMPSFSGKLNCDGLSPLHLALQNGHLETARQMIDLDGGLIRVPGRGKMTPLHYLVSIISNGDDSDVNNKVDLLIDFLWACPEAVNDVTVERKTPLHIAVASKSVDAFKVLFGWVCRTGQHSVLNNQDIDGNNLMHLAALNDQTEVRGRLKGFVSQTRENKGGLTPDDIIAERNKDIKVIKVPKSSKQEKGILSPNERRRTFLMSQETLLQKIIRIIVHAQRGISMEKRDMMLVVATLVATATYQVVLQPPSGIPTADHTTSQVAVRTNIFKWSSMTSSKRATLMMINGFMPMNTLALTLSLLFILFVLPFHLGAGLLHYTLFLMLASYSMVMYSILEKHILPFVITTVAYFVFVMAFLVQSQIYKSIKLSWKSKSYNLLNLQTQTVLRSPALMTDDNGKAKRQ